MTEEQKFADAMAALRAPHERLPGVVERINDIEFAAQPAAAGLREQILAICMRELTAKAVELHDQGCGWLRFAALADQYQFNLRASIIDSLPKEATPRSEVERVLSELQRKAWRREIDKIILAMELLGPGTRIVSVGFREIETDHGRITRRDLKKFRPAGWSNDGSWDSTFTSEIEIASAEADAREEATAAARGPWADNRNYDLP